MWPCGLVAMIPALGAGGPGFKSRLGPRFWNKLRITEIFSSEQNLYSDR